MALPAIVTAVVGAVVTAVVAILLSARFPIGVARRYSLELGFHADWAVIGLAMAALAVATMAVAVLTGWVVVSRRARASGRPSAFVRWTSRLDSPVLLIGSRLAVEPGRGRRAVPVRSAMLGAVVGVLGVVACFTFRSGLQDATSKPERAGVVWDAEVASGEGAVPAATAAKIVGDRDVAAVIDAGWHRAVPVNGTPVPLFGLRRIKGDLPLVVLNGRRPTSDDEVVFAPTTMKELGVSLGDRVRVGKVRSARVVGEVLLPATSHTDYDQSGLMTDAGVTRAMGGPDPGMEDYLLLKWRPRTNGNAAFSRVAKIAGTDLYSMPATLPTTVVDLGKLGTLPLALGVFFALLACAAVGHALVTSVRRRRTDFAVLRSIGFTKRQSRLSIAWQATLLAAVGVVIGVPLGVVVGRSVWRWLAHEFPVLYVPPMAVVAIVLVVPLALLIANLIAAAPAHQATRVRPAETLRAD
jgi:predicted lysophospholipase L1 biosynthesis ABC-type transport system permease subunit